MEKYLNMSIQIKFKVIDMKLEKAKYELLHGKWSEIDEDVYNFLNQNSNEVFTMMELAKRLDRPYSTMRYSIARLEKANKIETMKRRHDTKIIGSKKAMSKLKRLLNED